MNSVPFTSCSGGRLYEQAFFRAAAGDSLRPGGEALTLRGLRMTGLLHDGDRVKSPAAALDVGCGAGVSALLLASCGFTVTAVDPSPALLAEAGNRAAQKDGIPSPRFLPGRAESLPVSDGAYDLVICECVLSLVSDAVVAVREMNRVLRPGGMLLLTDVYIRLGGSGSCGSGFCLPSADGKSCLSGACTASELRGRLTQQGFAIREEEDHSRALAELAARLIFQGGSMAGLGLWLGTGCASSSATPDGLRRFGYMMLVAQKETGEPQKALS